jgi:predicted AAA+ superfamily ATPase
MRHDGMSGRTAQQFIDSLLGAVDISWFVFRG